MTPVRRWVTQIERRVRTGGPWALVELGLVGAGVVVVVACAIVAVGCAALRWVLTHEW